MRIEAGSAETTAAVPMHLYLESLCSFPPTKESASINYYMKQTLTQLDSLDYCPGATLL